MSSKENERTSSEPTDVKGAIPRERTYSECSATSEDGNNQSPGKRSYFPVLLRQRTTSQTFMVAGGMTSASPPTFVTLEEIIQAANGMKDMALVHQIVVDKDFKLQRYEPEPNSLHGMVKNNMHKAFWEILKQELDEDPPVYNQALVLLEDVKNGLFSVLLPQHTKIKQQISDILDSDLIKQQAEQGVLDFSHYAQYVLAVMSKLCAPIRDDNIKALMEKTDVIEVFKGILETLDLMALDMANFTIEMAKPEIIAHSVELERKKFADFIKVQPDGLQFTRQWLLSHLEIPPELPDADNRLAFVKNLTKKTFTRACIDLIDWDISKPFPETFMLDQTRLFDLQMRTTKLIITGAVLLITVSNVSPNLQSIAVFKQSIKDHTTVLLQNTDSEKDMHECLPNIAEQVAKDVSEATQKYSCHEMSEDALKLLKLQIMSISSPESKIAQLVKQRVKEFFFQIIESSTADPQKVPTGLTSLQRELTAIAGQFLRIVAHNSTVFCIYYFDIVDAALTNATT